MKYIYLWNMWFYIIQAYGHFVYIFNTKTLFLFTDYIYVLCKVVYIYEQCHSVLHGM